MFMLQILIPLDIKKEGDNNLAEKMKGEFGILLLFILIYYSSGYIIVL